MNDQQAPGVGNDIAGPGHNVVGTDQMAFHKHVALCGRTRALLKEAQVANNKQRQAAKADGIVLRDMDRALVVADMTAEEQRGHLNRQTAYLQWLKVPLGTQMGMFEGPDFTSESDELTDEIIQKAKGDGWRAGLKDEGDNPHDPNSPPGQAWLEGHHEGADQRKKAMKLGTAK